MFSISSADLNRDELIHSLSENQAGAIVVFEGWVRNHNEGKKVTSLEYQVYKELALKEGSKILEEAIGKFNLHAVKSVHREGHLALGDVAIWIGATASHRDDAFKATRYIIDEIKHRLPVWKKEHYEDQKPEWVFCKHHHHHVHFEEADFYQKQSRIIDQSKLSAASVVVIGAGGLGCPALVGLASAGIGKITIVDFDKISISNIHRQFLFSPNLIGEKKTIVAKNRLMELNPLIQVDAVDLRVDALNIEGLLLGHSLVLDCTDNMTTKYLIHDACFKLGIPLISASVYQFEGQIRTFDKKSGCLRCLGGNTPSDSMLGNCNDFGVLGVTTNTLGSLQASEAIQYIVHGKNVSQEFTLYLNLKDLSQMKIKNSKLPHCPTCSGKVELENSDLEVSLNELNSDFEVVDIRDFSDSDVDKFKNYPKKVVLCCHKGIRSHKLTQSLRASGHSHFYSLKGGACSL